MKYKHLFSLLSFLIILSINYTLCAFNPYQILGVTPYQSFERIEQVHNDLLLKYKTSSNLTNTTKLTKLKNEIKIKELNEALEEIKELNLVDGIQVSYLTSLTRIIISILTESAVYIVILYSIFHLSYFLYTILEYMYSYIYQTIVFYYIIEHMFSNFVDNRFEQIEVALVLPFVYRLFKKLYYKYFESDTGNDHQRIFKKRSKKKKVQEIEEKPEEIILNEEKVFKEELPGEEIKDDIQITEEKQRHKEDIL